MFENFITGTEYTINEKKNGRIELIANEGFWITDNIIYETSSFSKKITTKRPDLFGTVSDEDKILIEEIQAELQEEYENGGAE
jgi:hypothetical protein